MSRLDVLLRVVFIGFLCLLQPLSWGSLLVHALVAERLSKTHNIDPTALIRLTIDETRVLVREIMDLYPQDQWYYLCIGRSPTPLAEGLRLEAGEESVRTIPISQGKTLNPIEIAEPILPQWVEPVEILGKLLPTAEELHGRGILILDYTVTGASFANQMEIVERVFRRRDRTPPVIRGRAYFMTSGLLLKRNLQFYPVDYVQSPEVLGDAWFSTDFDWWAEYDDWRPSLDAGAPTKNDRYPLFREAFRHYWLNTGAERNCEGPLAMPPKFSF